MIGRCISLLVSSISNNIFILSLVLRIPCFCPFMWTSSVAGAESGRYFWTARAVKPGHVENCLLLIAFGSVCFGGLNAAWWSYLMSAAFYVMEYALYDRYLVWSVSVFVDVASIILFAIIVLPSILVLFYNTHYICFHHIVLCILRYRGR